MSKSVIHLDLHPIAKNGTALNSALHEAIDAATSKHLKAVEIIPGKGTGQLMKRVKTFLQQPHIKRKYKRIEIDSKNHGRLFVYFR